MKEPIDAVDRKILAIMDFAARTPLSEIARATHLSKQTVDYRIGQMQKNRIVEGFFPIINTPLLGYHYCRLFVQFGKLDQEIEEAFHQYIFAHKHIFWVFSFGGEYDYGLVYWAKSIAEFEQLSREFESKFGKFLKKKSEHVIVNVIHLSHKFLGGARNHRFDLKETDERIQLDSTDEKIIRQLTIDARMPLIEIANRAKLNPKVVGYRIKQLEKNNFIAGYRPVLNYEKLGLTYYKVFFNLDMEKSKKVEEFEQFLLNHPKVNFIVKGIGIEGDIDVELCVESTQGFFGFIKECKNAFPNLINDYKYLIYTKTIKVNYFPFA